MMQKLITVGNSKALTISKQILEEIGDIEMVNVQFEPKKKRLLIDFDQQEVVDTVIDPEVYVVAKSLLKRYKAAFSELAKK